jgi:inorganic pyrophosphatase
MLDATGQYHLFRPHPWHGLTIGEEAPAIVNAYIEITPFDLVKYEVDKASGYLRVDRPQRTSAQPPTLYGFIPHTYCAEEVQRLSPGSTVGDGDPLDICVVSERPIARTEIVLSAKVIGGLQMVDGGEADDKIIAVLKNDYVWGDVDDVDGLPHVLVERLEHYFRTYKLVPGTENRVSIERRYGRDHAMRVIEAAMRDYELAFPREHHTLTL